MPIDYTGFADYAEAWPDKLVEFFRDHIVDDDYQPFVKDFYEYCKEPDKDGPAVEEWLAT